MAIFYTLFSAQLSFFVMVQAELSLTEGELGCADAYPAPTKSPGIQTSEESVACLTVL